MKEDGVKWIAEQKQWVINFRFYEIILTQVYKVVRGTKDGEFGKIDRYNSPS